MSYPIDSFSKLELSDLLHKNLKFMGYKYMSPVQVAVISQLLDKKDVSYSSGPKTGKTVAFIIAAIQKLLSISAPTSTHVLIISPTKESAGETHDRILELITKTNLSVACTTQKTRGKAKPHIVVSTPDNIPSSLNEIFFFVLDEAEKLSPFKTQIGKAFKEITAEKQVVVVSNLGGDVSPLISLVSPDPTKIELKGDPLFKVSVEQEFISVKKDPEIILVLLCKELKEKTVVLFKNQSDVESAHKLFQGFGLKSAILVGDQSQESKDTSLVQFIEQKAKFLLASDVASRGIDLQSAENVVHFNAPEQIEEYQRRVEDSIKVEEDSLSTLFITEADRGFLKELISKSPTPIGKRKIESKDYNAIEKKAQSLGQERKAPAKQDKTNTAKKSKVEDKFDPKTWKEDGPLFSKPTMKEEGEGTIQTETDIVRENQEMVILVGAPASGKSTFTKRFFVPSERYEHVNRDTLKEMKKCVKAAETALDGGKSVVIDNTNPQKDDRKKFIEIAKGKKIPVRVYWFDFTKEMVLFMNKYREKLLKAKAPHIPTVAINQFFSKFRAPELSEGISEITEVNFVPKFESEEERALFYESE